MEIIRSPLGVKLAKFRGEVPSPADLKAVVRRKLGLSVELPHDAIDLTWLEPVAGRLTHLLFTSAQALGVDTLSEMTALRFLSLNATPRSEVDLSKLPVLKEVRAWGGGAQRIVSVLQSRSLSVAKLNSLRVAELELITAPLEWLSLGDCRALRSVPQFENPNTLTRLDFEGVTHLDCRKLSKLTALERVSFTSCRELENVAALLQLPHLRELTFDSCPTIVDAESLVDLKGVDVVVRGKNAFYREVREQANAQGLSNWGFSTSVPPSPSSVNAPNQYYLVHPAFTRPLSVPDEVNESVSWESATEDNSWHLLPPQAREERLMAFLMRLLSWSSRGGAADIDIGRGSGVDTLSADSIARLAEKLRTEPFFTVSRDGFERVQVLEGLDGGAIVTVNSAAEAFALISSQPST